MNIALKEKYDKLLKDFQNISIEYQKFQNLCKKIDMERSNDIQSLEKKIK